MTLDELRKLISQGESETLEFKTSTAKIKSAFETLCAFLNTHDGTVLIGVKDDGRIVGQQVTDQTNLEVSNMVSKLEPPSKIDVDYIAIDENKYVIKLTARSNPELVPYVLDGKPFWRIGSATKSMPQQHYQQILLEKAQTSRPWDTEIADDLTINDLDKDLIIKTLNDCIERGRIKPALATTDPKKALQTLTLLKKGYLINAAGILFCKNCELQLPQSLLRLAYFKSKTKNNMLDSKRIHGNAFELLNEVEAFLMRHMSISSEFIPGKMAREDNPDYSLRAIREAMVNAICHRDYSIDNGSISFIMYEDRLEITSHGTLPRGITLPELKQTHESFPRNAKITHVMYKQGIIEAVGTGTQEILAGCKAIGSPEPEFIERGITLVVLFYRNDNIAIAQISNRQKDILEIIRTLDICSTYQILRQLESPPSDRMLRNDLSQLEELGCIYRQKQGRSTLWKLKE